MASKPTMGVYKFTSCDGCQLAFLNLGEELLTLSQAVEIVHFPEAGPVNIRAKVDIAFIEGSISTPDEIQRIKTIRDNSQFLITIGACATAGGLQALRNFANKDQWIQSVYTNPEHIKTLDTSTAIADHIKVDLELWGCPVNGNQVMDVINSLLHKAEPAVRRNSVCMECKRQNNVCVMVANGEPCLGPVTQTGCYALCPAAGRECYGCYGPDESPNTNSLSQRFSELGLTDEQIARRFLFINNQAPAFLQAGKKSQETSNDQKTKKN